MEGAKCKVRHHHAPRGAVEDSDGPDTDDEHELERRACPSNRSVATSPSRATPSNTISRRVGWVDPYLHIGTVVHTRRLSGGGVSVAVVLLQLQCRGPSANASWKDST